MVVYLLSDRPFYMYMATNSMKMLRQYNNSIPVKVIFIETVPSLPEMGFEITKNEFLRICCELDVEVVHKPWFPIPGEEKFFLINKMYLSELEDQNVLFLDVDTFIFGDVAKLFEKYGDCDVAGCQNRWVCNHGWDGKYLSGDMLPFNGGVLLFNNGWHFGKSSEWSRIMKDFGEKRTPFARWVSCNNRSWNREEMAFSALVANSGAFYRYFDREDAHNVYWPNDLFELHKSVVAHTYTENWKKAYNNLRGHTTRKKIKKRLFL